MSYQKLSRNQIAERVAQDIPDGAYVNLGIGLPTKIASYLPSDKDVFLHSENGLLAFGPVPIRFCLHDRVHRRPKSRTDVGTNR